MSSPKPPQLSRTLQGLAIKWARIGFALTILLAVPAFLYSIKESSEQRATTVARTLARAFRPMITVDQDYRSAQYQMRGAMDLSPRESAVILNPSLKPFYDLPDGEKGACPEPGLFCWGRHFRNVTTIYPVYSDSESHDVFGYIQVTLEPIVDHRLIAILLVLLLTSFVIQAFGLTSALRQSSDLITHPIRAWASLLTKSPSDPTAIRRPAAPYEEMLPMQGAIDGLQGKIGQLEAEAAARAKSAAELSILMEVGHDLKTPLSQLSKAFAIHIDTVKTEARVDDEEVERVNRAMRRMGDLLRQLGMLKSSEKAQADPSIPCSDAVAETRIILGDLSHDPELVEKKGRISVEVTSSVERLSLVRVTRIGYYRVLENLIRNAIHAIPSGHGAITVQLKESCGRLAIAIRDNGSGIAPDIQNRIFDFDFTTKPRRGTGLGLGIVKRICSEIGATIEFSSIPQQGTEFLVTFDAEIASAVERSSENSSPSPIEEVRV